MKIGDNAYGGIYAGDHDGYHIICSPIEYELPFQVNWHQAKEYSKALGMVLPTKEEHNLLYELRKSNPKYFPKRDDYWYWTSTERMSTYAWVQSLYGGAQGTYGKTGTNYVRAIRRIKNLTYEQTLNIINA